MMAAFKLPAKPVESSFRSPPAPAASLKKDPLEGQEKEEDLEDSDDSPPPLYGGSEDEGELGQKRRGGEADDDDDVDDSDDEDPASPRGAAACPEAPADYRPPWSIAFTCRGSTWLSCYLATHTPRRPQASISHMLAACAAHCCVISPFVPVRK